MCTTHGPGLLSNSHLTPTSAMHKQITACCLALIVKVVCATLDKGIRLILVCLGHWSAHCSIVVAYFEDMKKSLSYFDWARGWRIFRMRTALPTTVTESVVVQMRMCETYLTSDVNAHPDNGTYGRIHALRISAAGEDGNSLAFMRTMLDEPLNWR